MNELLETRVAALERSARWWKASALALGLAVAVGFASTPGAEAHQEAASDLVRAREIHLVDGEGKVRGRLALTDGQPGLELFDESGVARISLVHTAEETALFLQDAEGTTRVGAAQFAHGGGGFALHGPQARGTAVLYLKGEASLTFLDEDGGVVARVPEPAGGRSP